MSDLCAVWAGAVWLTSAKSFFATFMDISDYATIPMVKWLIGTKGFV